LANILLEIVASTVEDCMVAESGGADRIESCTAIATAGLTPSLGALIEAKKRVRIPVMAMARPRAGGFCYSAQDFAVMQRDARLLLEHGADGIVFGILHSDGSVDTKRCGQMIEIAENKQTVFHRAFDVVADPSLALDQLIELGCTRVLTSGQQKTAYEGRELIRRLINRAAQRMEVLPGGGVRAHNVLSLVEATGCKQVHMTAFSARDDALTSASPGRFGSTPGAPLSANEQVDQGIVRRMREVLEGAAFSREFERKERMGQ
jgi:copper homeostasis protein